jgi:hypothetical protein
MSYTFSICSLVAHFFALYKCFHETKSFVVPHKKPQKISQRSVILITQAFTKLFTKLCEKTYTLNYTYTQSTYYIWWYSHNTKRRVLEKLRKGHVFKCEWIMLKLSNWTIFCHIIFCYAINTIFKYIYILNEPWTFLSNWRLMFACSNLSIFIKYC